MISVRTIIKHSTKISGANIVGAAISFPAGIIVARLLGPELLGTVGLVTLWLQYASWARPGLMAAAYREMPHLLGEGKKTEALKLQNLSISYEGILTLLPVSVLAMAAFFYKQPILKYGLALAAIQFTLATLNYFRGSIQWVFQRYNTVASITLIYRVATPLLAVSGAALAKAYGQLLAPLILEIAVLFYYYFYTPPLSFKPLKDHGEAWRLLCVGIPLSMLTLLYWGFRTADRTMVAAWFSLEQLGYFTFGLNFITLAIQLISDFTNVLQPILYSELGRLGKVYPLNGKITQLSVLILLFSAFGANLAQAGFGAFVFLFLPKFAPAIQIFEVLAFYMACVTASILPITLLNSIVLNRQNMIVLIQGICLAVNVGSGYMAFRMGWGIAGIALSSVIAQILLAIICFANVHRHLFQFKNKFQIAKFYGWLGGLLAAAAALYLVMHIMMPYRPQSYIARTLITRSILACLVWSFIGGFFYLVWFRQPRTALEHDNVS